MVLRRKQTTLYKDLNNQFEFIEGLPDIKKLKVENDINKLIVIDDLMHETKGNGDLLKLFTRGCHHWNISVIQIVQNLFFDGLRTSRINCDYIVLVKNPADKSNLVDVTKNSVTSFKNF